MKKRNLKDQIENKSKLKGVVYNLAKYNIFYNKYNLRIAIKNYEKNKI